jgi:hypothetical protein
MWNAARASRKIQPKPSVCLVAPWLARTTDAIVSRRGKKRAASGEAARRDRQANDQVQAKPGDRLLLSPSSKSD